MMTCFRFRSLRSVRCAPAPLALAAALLLAVPAPGAAQDRPQVDLTSLDSVVEALYASISGAAGEPRDWDLFRLVLHPTAAQLISTNVTTAGDTVHSVRTGEEFIQSTDGFFVQNGFFEQELGFSQDRFGNMAHRFSAYDSKRSLDDPAPYARGINSIQFLWDQGRWWIVSILWDSERPDNRIPTALGG